MSEERPIRNISRKTSIERYTYNKEVSNKRKQLIYFL